MSDDDRKRRLDEAESLREMQRRYRAEKFAQKKREENERYWKAARDRNDVISDRALMSIMGGKYSSWASHLTPESLETLIWVVGIYGGEYNKAKDMTGKNPTPRFSPPGMHEGRMIMGLEGIAAIQAGGYHPKHSPGGGDATHLAFAEHFRERLSAADSHEKWAVRLNERQLIDLLWFVGEYGIRANSSCCHRWEEYYPPPTFDVAPSSGRLMRRALRVMAALERGKEIDVKTAKKEILD